MGKITGKEGLVFEGPARVFDCEEDMLAALSENPDSMKVRPALGSVTMLLLQGLVAKILRCSYWVLSMGCAVVCLPFSLFSNDCCP